MCEKTYCEFCGSECYVCAHCGVPVSLDNNYGICDKNDNELPVRFCSEECLNKFEEEMLNGDA